MSRTIAVLAALGLTAGVAGRAEAGPIYTYVFTTDVASVGEPISGSFQVDSSHIGTSGNTDISSFITNLSFTGSGMTFTAPEFRPFTVTVNPAGDLTSDSGLGGFFFGIDTSNRLSLRVDASGMGMDHQSYSGFGFREGTIVLEGTGSWTRAFQQPAPVPEPSTFALAGLGGLGLVGVTCGRRRP